MTPSLWAGCAYRSAVLSVFTVSLSRLSVKLSVKRTTFRLVVKSFSFQSNSFQGIIVAEACLQTVRILTIPYDSFQISNKWNRWHTLRIAMAAEGDRGGTTPTNSLPPPGTGGYPTKIFSSGFDHKFICSHCKRILRDPLQSYCGHRFCRICCQELLGWGYCSERFITVYSCSIFCRICCQELLGWGCSERFISLYSAASLQLQCQVSQAKGAL